MRSGEQGGSAYRELSPAGIVPVLIDGDIRLTQSLAIIDYLDRAYPVPRLIPDEPAGRARALEIAQTIACEIHPINNLRVLKYLTGELGVDEAAKSAWYRHWVADGLSAVEQLLAAAPAGDFSVGDIPTIADCCLVPQVANAMRMGCNLRQYTRIQAIYAHCMAQDAFMKAEPQKQPDYIT